MTDLETQTIPWIMLDNRPVMIFRHAATPHGKRSHHNRIYYPTKQQSPGINTKIHLNMKHILAPLNSLTKLLINKYE